MMLSPAQRRAVERQGQDVCCVAGPGSGKTRVLVERFAWLVGKGADPEAILAITFTDRAAGEIKKRIAARFEADPPRRKQVEHAHVSTLHSFCLTLLREHAVRAGLDPQFRVMDEMEASIEQHAVMSRVLDAIADRRREEFRALAAVWASDQMAPSLLDVYESLRMAGGAGKTLEKLATFDSRPVLDAIRDELRELTENPGDCGTPARRRRIATLNQLLAGYGAAPWFEWLARLEKVDIQGIKNGHPVYDGLKRIRLRIPDARSHLAGEMNASRRELVRDILLAFDEAFSLRKRELAALDFLGLEEHAVELLRRDEEIRCHTQARFEAILMDELQDTNPVQWRILELIRRPGRFFAVGDINQSIYGFRHAEPSLFERYRKAVEEGGGEIDALELNYRSRKEILDTVSRISLGGQCSGIREHALEAGRGFEAGSAPFVEVQIVANDDESDEAMWIARRLRELHGTPLGGEGRTARFSDMAILARTKAMFPDLEAALARFAIPCVVQRGRNFFEEPEIIDLTNWLRVLENPNSEIALFALLRSPFFGVSDEDLFRRRLAGGLLAGDSGERIKRLRALQAAVPAAILLARAVDECGYAARLNPAGQANIEKFLRLLDDLEARHGRDLAKHLEFIAGLRTSGREANAAEVEALDAVQIMTIHGAKGLEFPIVVVAGMRRGDRGNDALLCVSPRNGLGLRWRLEDGTTVADPVMNAHVGELQEREAKELDRLLYVAMTRAGERLILSWTEQKRGGARWPELVAGALGIAVPAQPGVSETNPPFSVVPRAGQPGSVPPVEAASLRAAVEVRPAPLAGEAPSTVAVTGLSTFAQCPRRYFLQAAIGWPRPATAGGGAMELGSEAHEILAGMRTEASEEARKLANVFETSELARRCEKAARVEREMDFLVELGGTLVRGQIDLWFGDTRHAVIVDYKTDRYFTEARLSGYELQLRFYALALERLIGRVPGEAWLFPLRTGVPHEVDIGREKLSEALTTLCHWQEAELRRDFPPRESADCQWCPFAGGACPVSRPGTS